VNYDVLSRREFQALLPVGATVTGNFLSLTFTAFYAKAD
jgi:hypothetical protein